MRKKQKHQTPNTETQVPITKSIITERIFRLSILMFVLCSKRRMGVGETAIHCQEVFFNT